GHPFWRAVDRAHEGRPAGEARAALRDGRPALRGHCGAPSGQHEHGAEADRAGAILAARTDPAGRDRAGGQVARRALRRAHAERLRARRHPLRRQRAEGRARPRALVRPEDRGLQQADIRSRPEDDPGRPQAHPRAVRARGDLARHLDRPRGTARSLRPDRRPLARPRRGNRRQRPRGPAADRRADGRRKGRVTQTTAAAEVPEASPAREAAARHRQLAPFGDFLLRSILPLVLALGAGAIVLAAIGVDPIKYYKDIYVGGIELSAWQDSVMRMAPLLLMAVGLIVVFRAGIWNLGMD